MSMHLCSNVTQGKVANATVLSVLQFSIRPIKRSCSKGELEKEQNKITYIQHAQRLH